jgi:hypothetical protein
VKLVNARDPPNKYFESTVNLANKDAWKRRSIYLTQAKAFEPHAPAAVRHTAFGTNLGSNLSKDDSADDDFFDNVDEEIGEFDRVIPIVLTPKCMTALQDKFLPEGISKLLRQSTRFSHSFHVGGGEKRTKIEGSFRNSNIKKSKNTDKYSEESKNFATKVDRTGGFDGYRTLDLDSGPPDKRNIDPGHTKELWNKEKPLDYQSNNEPGADEKLNLQLASQAHENSIRIIEEIDNKKRALSEIMVKPNKNLNYMVSKVNSPFAVYNDTKKRFSEFDRTPSGENSKSDGQSVDIWRASDDMDNRPIATNKQPEKDKEQLLDQWLGNNDDNDTITEDVDAENEEDSERLSRYSKVKLGGVRQSEIKPIQNDEEEENELHKIHMLQSLQALQYMKKVSLPPMDELKDKLVFLPKPKLPHIRKTLIFDMDETLIHCVDDIDEEKPQVVLDVIFEDGEVVEAGVNVRPFAID